MLPHPAKNAPLHRESKLKRPASWTPRYCSRRRAARHMARQREKVEAPPEQSVATPHVHRRTPLLHFIQVAEDIGIPEVCE